MASRTSKAANRHDVYELVRLAHAFPEDSSEIDTALTQIAPGLSSKKKSHELAYILTLPDRAQPWVAVDAAVEGLISLGPQANQAVLATAQSAGDSTKERAARVLEGTGEKEKAAGLRATLGKATRTTTAALPAPPREKGTSDLERERTAVELLGFTVVSGSDGQIAAVRQKWHWAGLTASKVNYLVYLRSVSVLTSGEITADRDRLAKDARELDRSRLPRGWRGAVLVPVYLADQVEPTAGDLCASKPALGFAYFPAALDTTTGKTFFLRKTQFWGWQCYPWLRFIAQRLLDPEHAKKRKPISVPAIVVTVCFAVVVLSAIALLVLLSILGY
jgi:hypothetical protein